ncbi:MAG: flagellar regulator YcgR PilZN domain-containing protein [Burkholderiales bacterium]
MADICARLSGSGRVLVRSGIEIERLLASMVHDRDAVTASLPADHLFLSRLVSVNADDEEVVVAPSEHNPANRAVIASPSVTLKCNHRGAQFVFSCNGPRPTRHLGDLAIRMTTPRIVLAAQPRHDWPRAKMPTEPDVRCELRLGLVTFASRIVDVGLDGKAFIVSDPAIPVCDGTRLNGARVRNGEDETLVVDLEIDRVVQAKLPDGRPASRIGCRILAERPQLEKMIRLFIVDLQ